LYYLLRKFIKNSHSLQMKLAHQQSLQIVP